MRILNVQKLYVTVAFDGDEPALQARLRYTTSYDRVIAAAYKELPTSVVDQCRNLCAVLAARWLYQHSQESKYLVDDLGPGITSLVQFTRNERRLLGSALDVVNRLRLRGKDNEALKYDLRAVSDEDASLALHATGFVIREIGWAR